MLVGSACSHYLMTVSVRSLQLAVVKLFCFSVSQFTAWLSFSLSLFFFMTLICFTLGLDICGQAGGSWVSERGGISSLQSKLLVHGEFLLINCATCFS